VRVLTLAGSGRQRGLDHGREDGAEIARAATALKAHLAASGHPPDTLMRRLATGPLPRTASELVPDLWDEVTAMAHATRMPLDELLLLVFAPDLPAYAGAGAGAGAHGVAEPTVSFGGTAAARVIAGTAGDNAGGGLSGLSHEPIPPTTEIGQTVDLPAWARRRARALRIGAVDEPNSLVVAYPGCLGLCGANQSGVAVATTALPWAETSSQGLGVSFIVRRILQMSTFADAQAFLRSTPHAVGRAYLIAGPDGLGCFEADADGVHQSDDPLARTIAHADHRLANSTPASLRASASSRARLRAVSEALDADAAMTSAVGGDVARDGSRWDDPLVTFAAFRALGSEASARFIDGEALATRRDWTRLTYT
jgi:hypothetical protein